MSLIPMMIFDLDSFCASFLFVDQSIDLDSYSRSETYVIENRGKLRPSFSYFCDDGANKDPSDPADDT